MLKKPKKIDILGENSLNFAEIDKEIKVEISTLGSLDIFTNAHILGVVKYTTMICDTLSLDYETTKNLILSAYLHDIGKIMIPPQVLQKPGKLTDAEFEIMKMHTVYGYDIVMRYDNFKFIAPVVRGHHENLNGTGYPDGLTDKQIPEEAKLIKIADIFDALTAKRQYKEGMRASKAVDIMLEDVKKGKTGSKYLYYLLLRVIDDYETKNIENGKEIDELEVQLETLKELDDLYKRIYDQGYTKRLEKQLNHYNLPAGYDMTKNTNILVAKQNRLEIIKAEYNLLKEEIKLLTKQCKVAKRLIKFSERNVRLFGKYVY
jgi:HD superfamily phosphodiesterase